MNKILSQGIITIVLFAGTWFGLSQIDWVTLLNVEEATDSTEKKLGEIFWDVLRHNDGENVDPFVVNTLDSIVTHLCKANGINRKKIKAHIVERDDINAFALPDGHLVVNKGLILNARRQDELSGVICHELAHIEHDHVMKKLVKEIGFSVLLTMTTGDRGSDVIQESAKMLSSTAFDRGMEQEADSQAVEYMLSAKADPSALADFLYRLAYEDGEAMKYLSWISTHPDSKERAKAIVEIAAKKSVDFKPIISNETWNKLKQRCKEQ